MVVERIVSLIREITSKANTVTKMDSEREFSIFSQSAGIHYVVSELEQLVSLPLRIRQIQYQSAINDENDREKFNLDYCISDVISSATNVLSVQIGDDESKKWGGGLYQKISMILAGRGPVGLFSGENAISRITFEDNKTQSVENLEFRFPLGWTKIAERRMRHGESRTFLEGFEVMQTNSTNYDKLLTSLQVLKQNTVLHGGDKFHHIFAWSDRPIAEFQKSLVDNVVKSYVRNAGHNQHNSKLFLFISTNSDTTKSRKEFTEREKIALKRCFQDGVIYFAPGKSEKVFRDDIMKLSRPDSIFDDRSFVTNVDERITTLGLKNQRLMSALQEAIHEGVSDLNQLSAIVISSDCWTGTWSESKEIDGEQVMS